jgi:hypothetical protein
MRHATRVGFCKACGFAMLLLTVATALGPARAAQSIAVELNKLEAQNKSCRAYLVIDNPSDTAFQVLKLDLIFFRQDGVIDRRLAVDLGPMRPNKRSVKSFDLDGMPCEGIGSVLVNDVMECRDAASPVTDCLSHLTVASRAGIPLSK